MSQNQIANATAMIEIGGYPRPDTIQMLPFKPKLPPASYHPVPGGILPLTDNILK
jgi:hypothetical protein